MLEPLPEGPAAKAPQLGHWLLVLANALQQNLATGIRAQLGRAATLAELTPPDEPPTISAPSIECEYAGRRCRRLIYEDGDRTSAEAVLLTSAVTELRSEGIARRNPKDTDMPESGLELATSPALSGSHSHHVGCVAYLSRTGPKVIAIA